MPLYWALNASQEQWGLVNKPAANRANGSAVLEPPGMELRPRALWFVLRPSGFTPQSCVLQLHRAGWREQGGTSRRDEEKLCGLSMM